MRNRKLIFVLLPLAIFIWGLIFYKIFMYINGDHTKPALYQKGDSLPANPIFHDTITLIAHYRDPFLDVFEARGNTVKSMKAQENIRKEDLFPQLRKVTWPDLIFRGIIVQKGSTQPTGLLVINGVNLLIKNGETYQNVRIHNIYSDSVIVFFQKERKTIYKTGL